MKHAVIPGSYSPITVGHLDLIKRTSEMFDKVTVLICVNSSKRDFIDTETKKILAEDAVRNLDNVHVDVCGGLFADYCHDNKVDIIVKGIRNNADYTYENELKTYNDRIFLDKYNKIPETLFMPANKEFGFCSSTFVREMLKYNESVKAYVPDEELLLRYITRP